MILKLTADLQLFIYDFKISLSYADEDFSRTPMTKHLITRTPMMQHLITRTPMMQHLITRTPMTQHLFTRTPKI